MFRRRSSPLSLLDIPKLNSGKPNTAMSRVVRFLRRRTKPCRSCCNLDKRVQSFNESEGCMKSSFFVRSCITSTFTGPRRKSLFQKAARPAAPCATYCYHAYSIGYSPFFRARSSMSRMSVRSLNQSTLVSSQFS